MKIKMKIGGNPLPVLGSAEWQKEFFKALKTPSFNFKPSPDLKDKVEDRQALAWKEHPLKIHKAKQFLLNLGV